MVPNHGYNVIQHNNCQNLKSLFFQDETPKSRGQTVVRNIELQQDNTTMQLAMWRNKSSSPVKVGDRVTCTHVRVIHNPHLQALSLNTTTKSEIKVGMLSCKIQYVGIN